MSKLKPKTPLTPHNPFADVFEDSPTHDIESVVLPPEAQDDLALFTPKSKPGATAKYRMDDKILAIMFLEASQREYEGKFIPNYRKTGETLQIPHHTLMDWWKKKDYLLKQANDLTDKLSNYMIIKMSMECLRILESFGREDYINAKMKDRTFLLNTLIGKMRLLAYKSTENVAHEHRHTGKVALIPREEKENVSKTTDKK